MSTANETSAHKLGKTRAGERSRVWLEGDRLKRAGFTAGKHYTAQWLPATLILRAVGSESAARDYAEGREDAIEVRKVSGKEGKPIIDIVGARVFETFGARAERVRVSYADGVITIRAEV